MSDSGRPGVVVIGVGNSMLSDEGVGGCVARRVARLACPRVEVVQAELPGPGLLRLLEHRSKAVIVDAVDAGQAPGTVFRFTPDEVQSEQPRRPCSLHQGDVLHHVRLAKALGMCPPEVVLIGIQPETFSPGKKLSPAGA